MIGPILRRARKGNSRRIIMEAHLPHFSHNPRPTPFSAPPRNTNQKPARFSSVRVGRNSIRPTDGHTGGRTNRKIAIFSGTRVGRNSIRPTDGHAGGRTDRKNAIFLGRPCRGVLHTSHRRPRQRPNESHPHPKIHSPNKTRPYPHPVSHSSDKNAPQPCRVFHSPTEKHPQP